MGLIPWKEKRREVGPAETSPLATLRGEIDRLFDTFVREPLGGLEWPFGGRGWSPAIDVAEDQNEFTVRAELPGLAPEDVDITISGSNLVLAGEKKESTEKKERDFYHTESHYGVFQRTIPLPQAVDPDQVDAEYANGVLTIHLKKSPSSSAKRIQVKTKD